MKLEVGMFVRTPKGIAKIETIEEDRTEIYFNCDTGLSISFIKKDFTREEMAEFYKHSYNIIDLIEVGDYVNGHRVLEIFKDRIKFGEDGLVLARKSNYDNYFLYIEDIKSIVTKEQFESVQYKVERGE